MSDSQKPAARKPASKFPELRKKMEKNKLRGAVKASVPGVQRAVIRWNPLSDGSIGDVLEGFVIKHCCDEGLGKKMSSLR